MKLEMAGTAVWSKALPAANRWALGRLERQEQADL